MFDFFSQWKNIMDPTSGALIETASTIVDALMYVISILSGIIILGYRLFCKELKKTERQRLADRQEQKELLELQGRDRLAIAKTLQNLTTTIQNLASSISDKENIQEYK